MEHTAPPTTPKEPPGNDNFVASNRSAWNALKDRTPKKDRDWTVSMMAEYVSSANWTGNPKLNSNDLARGQLVAPPQEQEAGDRGITRKQIRGRRALLRSRGEIAMSTDNHSTVITVVKYDEYTRTPEKGPTKNGDITERIGENGGKKGQPNAKRANQIDQKGPTKKAPITERNDDGQEKKGPTKNGKKGPFLRSTTKKEKYVRTSLSSFFPEAEEIISVAEGFGWTVNSKNLENMLACLKHHQAKHGKGNGGRRLLFKARYIADGDMDNKGARFAAFVNRPESWINDQIDTPTIWKRPKTDEEIKKEQEARYRKPLDEDDFRRLLAEGFTDGMQDTLDALIAHPLEQGSWIKNSNYKLLYAIAAQLRAAEAAVAA